MENQNKNQNQKWNQVSDRMNVDGLTSFYNENKKVINGIGVAALAGAAIYSAVKYVPFQEICTKVEEKYHDYFSDREVSNSYGHS